MQCKFIQKCCVTNQNLRNNRFDEDEDDDENDKDEEDDDDDDCICFVLFLVFFPWLSGRGFFLCVCSSCSCFLCFEEHVIYCCEHCLLCLAKFRSRQHELETGN